MKGLDVVRRIFLKPLLEEKPENMEERDYLNTVLNKHTRHICTYRALRDVTVQGTFMQEGVHPIEGITKGRDVPRGHLLTVRKDETEAYYDAELLSGDVFRVTVGQWKRLRKLLRPAKGQVSID